MTESADRIRALDAAHVVQVYRRAPVVFDRGAGVYLYDLDGTAYLDLVSGVGVAALGHAHPKLARALADQAATLVHTSNLYHHPLQGRLAGRLAELSGLPRAFFCNSGSEAVETCLKFARRFWHTQGEPRRTRFVALEHSFHGRTFGSLSVTAEAHYRRPFAPLLEGVTFVPPTDPAALRRAADASTAAIILEPIQGEGGVRPLGADFVRAVQQVQQDTGALLIADEVQSGLGRTGRAFYSAALGLRPDLMAIGKALGAGVPIGAALVSDAVAAAVSPGDHGSTYGGNLLACRAALVFLEELVDGELLSHVAEAGAHLEARLRELARRRTAITEVRGAGLMWGLALPGDAAPVVGAALQRHVLVNRTAGTVIRLLPPLIISPDEIDRGIDALEAALEAAPVEVGS